MIPVIRNVIGSPLSGNVFRPKGNSFWGGLIAYWRMGELVWDGIADEVGDSSGNGNHGTATNAVTIAGGKLGRGGDFNA